MTATKARQPRTDKKPPESVAVLSEPLDAASIGNLVWEATGSLRRSRGGSPGEDPARVAFLSLVSENVVFDEASEEASAEDSEFQIHKLVYPTRKGATSLKLSNLRFNLRSVLEGGAASAIIASSITSILFLPAAVVLIGLAVKDCFSTDVPESAAAVLFAVWQNDGFGKSLTEARIRHLVNSYLRAKGREPLGEAEVRQALSVLCESGCFERSQDRRHRLVEMVVVAARH